MFDDRPVHTWLTDMDGVLVREEEPIPGAAEFLAALTWASVSFMVLTNNSIYAPRDLRVRLLRAGLDVPETAIWTSALATAQFLADQRPDGSAYVIGEAGLTTALHDIGYVITDRDPDYVVLGRDAQSVLPVDYPCDPAHQPRCPVHCHQPRPEWTQPARHGSRNGVRRCHDQHSDEPPPVLHRQAQSAHDA